MQRRSLGRKTVFSSFLLGTSALSMLAMPETVQAQDDSEFEFEMAEPAKPGEGADDGVPGNTIIVTATKRQQTLQDVPVAVTVTTADTLERAQIRDLRDLQSVVPSLRVKQLSSSANVNFLIRGFGNGANNPGIEPSVGVFVDNVYRSRTAAQITDLPDVQRIEVLRGPQSTLFGKNASAGVVSIVTKKPQFDLTGSAELTYGNYDQRIAKGYVTGPVTDSLAVSLAGGINKRDGFYRDLGTDTRSNDRDRWFARGQALFDPGTGLSVRLIADYDKIDETCCAVFSLREGQAAQAIQALGGRTNDIDDPFRDDVIYNNYISTNDIENYGVSAQVDYQLGPLTLSSISAYRHTDSVTAQDSDFTSADLIYPNAGNLDLDTFTQEFRASASFADIFSLLLGGFYIHEKVDQHNDLRFGSQFRDYADLMIGSASGGLLSTPSLETAFGQADGTSYAGQFFTEGEGFDENYALKSDAFSIFGQVDVQVASGLTLTLGGNYTNDSKRFSTDTVSSDVFSAIDLDAPQYAAFRQQLLLGGALQQAGINPADPAAVAAFAGDPATADTFQAMQAYAAGNANNPAANPLAALTPLQLLPPFLNIPNAVEDGKTDDDKFTYTVRLAYDVDPALNLYVSYATGFKASSINLSRDSRPSPSSRAALADAGLTLNNLTYGSRYAGPENSRVIEGGAKADLGWASGNLAVFHQQIKGFQSNIFTGTGFALLNAGKQSTFGVEFEGQVTPLDRLTLNMGVTYLDPTYDSFRDSAVGDLSGERPAGIPTWSIMLGAQYSQPIGNGVITPRVSYLYQSDTRLEDGFPNFVERDAQGDIVDSSVARALAAEYTREVNDLTASLAYEMDAGITLSVWGRNLLDDRNYSTVFDTPAQPGGISGYPTDPRTYGASVRFSW
ncbi:TonB-dependent receptor [Altericroceibacterium spongiae]|uniref:TonB-dependent receptor n=1 Tax=Altericroceibacterium spongiae TaxID=2320269 RepID=A0A420EQL4_9SPHN|nr:TonB-dependent receptor [Altericroceibacterium spongiae]RKF22967.1 TonB-dependent receptor [Altericroceibacterium spongiae]